LKVIWAVIEISYSVALPSASKVTGVTPKPVTAPRSTGDKKLSKFAGDTARALNQIDNRIERKLAKGAAS
jgi:hypothetical protein